MNSSTSGWLVLTRNFVAGSHPQNDNNRRDVIATVFKGVHNRMKSGYLHARSHQRHPFHPSDSLQIETVENFHRKFW